MTQLNGEVISGIPELPLKRKGKTWGKQGETTPALGGKRACLQGCEHCRGGTAALCTKHVQPWAPALPAWAKIHGL